MNAVRRYSSRRERLDHAFLAARLKNARSYKRIAGYFRSSIFELVGEEIAAIPIVQIVCNSELDAADVVVSKHVRETMLKERWNEAPSEVEALLHRERYRRLHDLLVSGQRDDLGATGRWPGVDPVSVHPDAAMASGACGQAGNSRRGVVVRQEGVDRPQGTRDQDPRRRGHCALSVSNRHRVHRADHPRLG